MPQNAALRVTKNTVTLFIGRVSAKVFSFALVVYAARFLGVDGFGKYALARGYFELFLSLSATGLSILITREIARRPSWASQYLSVSMMLVTVLTLVASGLLVILAHVFGYASDTRAAIYLVCLALLPATISQVFEAAFVAFERAEYVTYGTLLENIVRTGLGLIALFMGYGLLALFVVLIVTRICMLLFYLVFLSRRVSKLHWYFDWAFLKQLVRDWRVFALENWLSNLFLSLDVIVLSSFHGELAVGLYAAAYKVLGLGTVAAKSYTTAIFPYMSRLFKEARETFQRLSEGSLKYMLALVLPGVVTIAFLADRIILLLYTDDYADSILILRVLIWVLVLRSLNPFLSHILFARGEQRKSLQVAAISLAFYVAVCLWFTRRWGGTGTAWALLLAMCVAFCLYFVFVFRGEGAMRMLLTFGRTALAAVSVGGFVLTLRDTHLVPLLSSAAILYVLLLLILRVPSSSDLELFRGVAMRVLRQAGTVLRRA